MLKKIASSLPLFFLVCLGCKQRGELLRSTNTSFAQVFTFQDSVDLKADSISSLIGIREGAHDAFLVIDYEGKKVAEFDRSGTYRRAVLDEVLAGTRRKKMGSPISIAYVKDKLLVADNNNRRIYTVDTARGEIRGSFILSGTHMTPLHMLLVGDRMVMSGYNIDGDHFLNLYSLGGTYVKSFMKASSDIADTRYVVSPLNYVSLAAHGDTLYTTELMDYTINAFDDNGNLLFQRKYTPDYFVPLTAQLLKQATSSFEDIRGAFSKPSTIAAVNDKLLVEVEMPVKNSGTSADYYNTRQYVIDLFSLRGEPIKIGIPAFNYTFLYYEPQSQCCYFLTRHDAVRKVYTIKKFKLNI